MSGSSVFFKDHRYSSQTFNSSGTFNVPDGVNLVFIEMWGAGGAGGATASTDRDAFGGQAGGYVIAPVVVTPGGTVSVTIGTGGSGVNGSGLGNSGTDSRFGPFYARGGTGGAVNGSYFGLAGDGTDSIRANGGSSYDSGGTNSYGGGNAGYGNGGDSFDGTNPAQDGGIGAGGGAGNALGPCSRSARIFSAWPG